jgi:hypothetical protein
LPRTVTHNEETLNKRARKLLSTAWIQFWTKKGQTHHSKFNRILLHLQDSIHPKIDMICCGTWAFVICTWNRDSVDGNWWVWKRS